jgi:hypothetical protein
MVVRLTGKCHALLSGLVLELDAAYSNSTIESPDQVDQSQELTYVDIDTFLTTF